jgi:acetyl-CoA carboxylase biotin carboxyl carrier protein
VSGDDHDRIACLIRWQGWLLCRAEEHVDIEAHITGTVWKVEVSVGDEVDEGDTVVILESMKMEMPVEAEDPGTVAEVRCEEGQSVQEGDVLVVLE